MRVADGPTALVRPPGRRLPEGLVTHGPRQPVDVELARKQWQAYVDAMETSGWRTVVVASADECPDAVFVEDTAVVYGDVAAVCRPGDPSRRPEVGAVESMLADFGYRPHPIEAPGTIDGGDVMKVGSTIYIGESARTNREGIRQAGAVFAAAGATVIPVAPAAMSNGAVLHLKSAVTALPDGRVIGYGPLVNDPSIFGDFVEMPEEGGAHVVDLGGGRLLVADHCPASAELLTTMGYEPVIVDISEFEKLDGCVTCLSIRLRL